MTSLHILVRPASIVACVLLGSLAVACSDDDSPKPPAGSAGSSAAGQGGNDQGGNDQGGNDQGGQGGGGTNVPLDQLGARLGAAFCATTSACLGTLVQLTGVDEKACLDSYVLNFNEATLPTLQANITSGATVYDGTRVDACIEKLTALGCNVSAARFAELCGDMLHGTVAANGTCTDHSECELGSSCQFTTSCPGACAPRLGVNGPCHSSEDCLSGLVCSPTKNRCAPPLAEGASCNGDIPCALGSTCAGEAGKLTCRSGATIYALQEGQACDLFKAELCDPKLSCVFTTVENKVPKFACAARGSSGAPCKVAVPDACPVGEYCDGVDLNAMPPVTDGTCKPLAAEGAPCAKTLANGGCAANLTCVQGTCKAHAKNGTACTVDAECISTCEQGSCAPSTTCNTTF